MFLRFANFYRQFIQGFSWIAASLTSMLKTSRSTKSKTRPGEGRVGVGGSRGRRAGSKLDKSEIDDDKVDDDEVEDDEIETKVQKSSKCKLLSKSKKMVGSDFFTLGAKLAFIKLKEAFFKASILHYFDPEHSI